MNSIDSLPTVSILMPAYNAAPYLDACLQSIIDQSYLQWELYVVDDQSTDDTYQILRKYAALDKRIKIFKNTSKGIIPALRLAYTSSQGQFVSRMDADDIMSTHKIETLLKAAIDNPTSCITNYVEYFSDSRLQEGFLNYASWLNSLIDQNTHWESIYQECVIPSPSWMMSRSTLDKVGAFELHIYPEDYDLCFRLYANRIPVIGIPDVLHLWRDHPDRASRNDPHYADQSFFSLKLHYFLKLDFNPSFPLFLWGGGPTGKALARRLLEENISFRWCTGNQAKVGKHIYDVLMEPETNLLQQENAQIVLAIKEPAFIRDNETYRQLNTSKNRLFRFH